MSSSINEANLEKKFQSVTNTQDSIQTLSLWILHHKAHHQKVVNSWMKVLKKSKISHRLTLFYVANDVVQNGKRKGVPQFGESFAEVLREATLLVRDEQIRPNVQRVFNIWEERSVYESDFIADLHGILANAKVPMTAPSKLLAEFKHENVISKLRSVKKLEVETANKMASLNISKLNATNAEIVQQFKDRRHGQQFSCDFDENSRCLEDVIQTLTKEIKERTELILLLEQSEIYYDTQRGEAKIVANAYKNFSGRVKALQKKLEELMATFPSPIPSPCPDAPSPTTSDMDDEFNLSIDKDQSPEELENLINVPSPVGSPEGLTPSSPESSPLKTVGNPIPTLSNFFTQDSSMMSSWLDAFPSKSTSSVEVSTPEASAITSSSVAKNDSSSLDSRLSNLLQNIPNLPSGLQSTLFASPAANTSSQDTVRSPETHQDDKTHTSASSEVTPPPVKDERSGQNTPLQDEDTHSSHTAAFFTKVAVNSKNPNDILKGLTSLIQTASSDKKASFGENNSSWFSEKSDAFGEKTDISNFVKKIISPVPEVSHVNTAAAVPQHTSALNLENSNTSTIPVPDASVCAAYSLHTSSYMDSTTIVPPYTSEAVAPPYDPEAPYTSETVVPPYTSEAVATPYDPEAPYTSETVVPPYNSEAVATPYNPEAPYTSETVVPPYTSEATLPPYPSETAVPHYSSKIASSQYSSEIAAPPYNTETAVPPYASDASVPLYTSEITAPPYTSAVTVPQYTSGVTVPPYTSGNSVLPYTTETAALPYTSGPAAHHYASDASLPPYRSDTANAAVFQENMSYIPTLVPSTPLGSNFNYATGNYTEYNTKLQNYKMNESVNSGISSRTTAPTKLHKESIATSDFKMEKPPITPPVRQSTLITVIPDNNVLDHQKTNVKPSSTEITYPLFSESTQWPVSTAQSQLPLKDNVTNSNVKIEAGNSVENVDINTADYAADVSEHKSPGDTNSSVNNNNMAHLRIETVQSHRKNISDNRWSGNNWNAHNHNQQGNYYNSELGPHNRRPREYHDYHHKRPFQPPFPNRCNWQPRIRHFPDQPFGPPPFKRFAPFPPRGRGWRRHPPQF